MGVTVSLDCPRPDCGAWIMVSFEDDDPVAVYGKEARPDECAAGHRMTERERGALVTEAWTVWGNHLAAEGHEVQRLKR